MPCDPMTADAGELERREEEEAREQRWAEFVLTVHRWGIDRTLRAVVYLREQSADSTTGHPRYELYREVEQFIESDGWPSVLSALARALRETE